MTHDSAWKDPTRLFVIRSIGGSRYWASSDNDQGVIGWGDLRTATVYTYEEMRSHPFPKSRDCCYEPLPAVLGHTLNTASLRAQLDSMRLHDNTGTPEDNAVMSVITQLDEWLTNGDNDD